jgi:hypothetical protein
MDLEYKADDKLIDERFYSAVDNESFFTQHEFLEQKKKNIYIKKNILYYLVSLYFWLLEWISLYLQIK